MAPITTTTEVDRSVEDVFAYAMDPTRFHQWQRASSMATWTSPALRAWGRTA
jgi:hypothetical protein